MNSDFIDKLNAEDAERVNIVLDDVKKIVLHYKLQQKISDALKDEKEFSDAIYNSMLKTFIMAFTIVKVMDSHERLPEYISKAQDLSEAVYQILGHQAD